MLVGTVSKSQFIDRIAIFELKFSNNSVNILLNIKIGICFQVTLTDLLKEKKTAIFIGDFLRVLLRLFVECKISIDFNSKFSTSGCGKIAIVTPASSDNGEILNKICFNY